GALCPLRPCPQRRFPRWALVFPLWWAAMLIILWPVLGALAAAVALYGLVLGGTAATAARCSPLVAARRRAFFGVGYGPVFSDLYA
ncbi:MAG: hypothetical protein ABTA24_16165, partial [Arthrobacter sp.]